MIQSLTIINGKNSIELELLKPDKSGYLLSDITGIDPGIATINTTDLANIDGSRYNSSRIDQRNIVASFYLLEQPEVEDTRQKMYKYISLKDKVTLKIKTKNNTSMIDGYVESIEVPIFEEHESMQVSFICPNPYFRRDKPNVVWLRGTQPLFHFPFSNESLTEPKLIFGQIDEGDGVKNLEFVGDKSLGVTFHIRKYKGADTLNIYNLDTNEKFSVDIKSMSDFVGDDPYGDDEIIYCSIPGEKRISVMRGIVPVNIINFTNRDLAWFTLKKGDNIFYCETEPRVQGLECWVEYNSYYLGV